VADRRCAVVYKALPSAMQRLNVLLLFSSHRHKWNMRLAHRGADCLSVVSVVLLSPHERLHILRAYDLHRMPEFLELPRPAERAGAGFDRDGAWLDAAKYTEELIAHHSSFEDRAASSIGSMQLKDVPRDIDVEDVYGGRGSLLLCRRPKFAEVEGEPSIPLAGASNMAVWERTS